MRAKLTDLLSRLLVTHSPSGEEGEMEALLRELLAGRCDEVWTDANDNVLGRIRGESSADPLVLMAHKDEIGLIARKIEDDGKIWFEPLGGALAFLYGEGPFDILGDEVITGVISLGSTHSSHLSPTINSARTTPMNWEMCYLDCKLSREELEARGVRVGSRACVARSRKTPLTLGDCVCGYALDDKAAVAVLLLTADLLRAGDRRPARDTILAFTGNEETGCGGGIYVAGQLGATTQIAVEIAPVAPEYPIAMGPEPVVFYKDAVYTYHKRLADRLCALADRDCGGHQRLLVRSFGSDTSAAIQHGLAARGACIGFATENTHGYEMGSLTGMENCARLLLAYAVEGDG